MAGGVTPIRKDPEYVANCPACRSTVWNLCLDGVNDEWKNIIGTECDSCGFFVSWVLASEKKNKNSDVKNLKILVATAYDIVDKDLLPNIATMAIQDFGRLNRFMIDAGPIKKEIEDNE